MRNPSRKDQHIAQDTSSALKFKGPFCPSENSFPESATLICAGWPSVVGKKEINCIKNKDLNKIKDKHWLKLDQPCHCRDSSYQHHHHHLSLNREGRWGTTDDFTASFLHLSLFSTALWDLANSRPVLSLMLSSHLYFLSVLPSSPFTVPCKMVLARPDERDYIPGTKPYQAVLLKRASYSIPFAKSRTDSKRPHLVAAGQTV